MLAADGIESTFYEAAEGRVSIAARLRADGPVAGKPLVLLSHIDVVPVEPEHWEVPAFSGEVRDGVIWGRGALDMKGMGVMQLMAMSLLKRHRVALARDVVLLAVADEEEGGRMGIHFVRDVAPELLDAQWVLNEGAYGLCQFLGQDVRLFGLAPSEKSPCWIRLIARGRPGHASVPHRDNAVTKLVRALARIDAHARSARVTPPVRAMLQTLVRRGLLPADLEVDDPATIEMLASADAHLHAITHDTVNLTGLRAGSKHNVIPARAEATLDCRLLPDTDPHAFVEELRRIIDDGDIEIERVLEHDAGQSSLDTPLVKVVNDVIAERYGAAAGVLPMLSPGFTDSHAYRAAGAAAYGFIPALLTREELATIHGHNERIRVDDLRLGTEILFDVVRRLVAAA